jgi:hypothetical protein
MSIDQDAYGWDTKRIDDPNESDYTLLTPGEYPFRITKTERGWHNGSEKLPPCNRLTLTLEVNGGAQGTATLKNNLFLHRKMDGLNCQFFTCVGLRKHGDPLILNWAMLPGATGMVQIAHREGKDGRKFNDAKRFIDPPCANGPQAAPPTPAAPPVAPAQAQDGFPWDKEEETF